MGCGNSNKQEGANNNGLARITWILSSKWFVYYGPSPLCQTQTVYAGRVIWWSDCEFISRCVKMFSFSWSKNSSRRNSYVNKVGKMSWVFPLFHIIFFVCYFSVWEEPLEVWPYLCVRKTIWTITNVFPFLG